MNLEQKYERTYLPNAVAAARISDNMTVFEAFQCERLLSTEALIVVVFHWDEATGDIEVVYGFRTDYLLTETARRIAENVVSRFIKDEVFPPVYVVFNWDEIQVLEEEALMRPDDIEPLWWRVETVNTAVPEPIPLGAFATSTYWDDQEEDGDND